MLTIDNTNKLKDIMEFDSNKSYYVFACMLREKDYRDKNEKPILSNKDVKETMVRTWYINSYESLENQLKDMLTLTEMLKCRLYMCTDRKNIIKTVISMNNKTNAYLNNYIISGGKTEISLKSMTRLLYSSSSASESSDNNCHKWLFDIDIKSLSLVDHITYIANLYEAHPTVFETKNGYHVVCDRKFDANIWLSKMPDKAFEFGKQMEWLDNQNKLMVEVKDNAMVLVAMGV